MTGTTATGVNWTATGGTISGTGLSVTYTAPSKAGTYIVTATSQFDPTESSLAVIAVTAPPSPPGTVKVTVSPVTATIDASTSVIMMASITGTSDQAVTWTTTGGTITGTGTTVTYTAPASAGTFTVVATSVASAGASAAATITVNSAPSKVPVTITLLPTQATMLGASTQQFTATVSGSSDTGVIWTTNGGTIPSTGSPVTFTAPSTPGMYTVSATAHADNSAIGFATITVPKPTLNVTPPNPTTGAGGTVGLIASVGNTADTRVTWKASAGTISGSGNNVIYTAPATPGTYSITVTSVADPTVSSTFSVRVVSIAVSVTPTSATIFGDQTVNMLATVTGSGGVIWTATQGNIIGSGLAVTYQAPSTAGTFTVTATSDTDPTKFASANITVQQAAVLVSPATAIMFVGTNKTFSAVVQGSPSDPINWSTSAGSLSTSSGPSVTLTAPGSTGTLTLTATDANDPSKFASAVITVSNVPPVDGLFITGNEPHPRLWWNANRLAKARAYYAAHPFTPTSTDYFNIAQMHVVNGLDCTPTINYALTDPVGTDSDQARDVGENAILAYDWCFDQLTSAQKAQLITLNNAFVNFFSTSRVDTGHAENNYYWGFMRNEIEWGIATFGENASALTFLNNGMVSRWTNISIPFAAGPGSGGLSMEGTEYGSINPFYAAIPFTTAKLLGRDMFNETDSFKDNVFWAIYMTMPSPTFNISSKLTVPLMAPFNDDESYANAGVLFQRVFWLDFMTASSYYWSDIGVGKYARQWTTLYPPSVVKATDTVSQGPYRYEAAQDTGGTTLPFTNLPLDFFVKGNSYFYGKTAWDNTSTVFSWQLSHPNGVAHVHDDWGSWQIWRNGRWLSRESTGYSDFYTGYAGVGHTVSSRSLAHNMPVINCNGDCAGTLAGGPLDLPSNSSEANSDVVVHRLESQPDYAYADVDLTGWYTFHPTDKRNFGANHVEREFIYVRPLETTVILDRLVVNDLSASGGPSAIAMKKAFLAHFEVNPTIEDASHVTETNGTQILRLTTLVPPAPTYRVINEAGCTASGGFPACSSVGQFRLEVEDSGAAQSYFLHVLQGRDAAGSNLTASVVDSNPGNVTTGTFTVTLHPISGPDTVIVFQKGTTSSGGTIDVNGAGTVNLRSDVQQIQYTDDGPVWQ